MCRLITSSVGCIALLTTVLFANDQQTPMPMAALMVLTGPDSHVKKESHFRSHTADEWKKVWMSHHGVDLKNELSAPDARLTVDFDRCMVLSIFLGRKSNTSGLRVETITESADKITVRIEHITFQTLGPAVKAVPYGFVLLPKSAKTIVIEENHQELKNSPPKWEKQAELPGPANAQ